MSFNTEAAAAIVPQGGVKHLGALVHQRFQRGGAGGWGRRVGGVGALPRAQERWSCDRDLGSSGTWPASGFYCLPATAWHSHANERGRTEGGRAADVGGGSCGGQAAQSVV